MTGRVREWAFWQWVWRHLPAVDRKQAPGYRFGAAPTSDEMAERCAVLEVRLADALAQLEGSERRRKAGTVVAPAQMARLAKLIEECAEVQQAAAKALLEGYEAGTRKGVRMTRRMMLERELGDLSAAAAELYCAGELRLREVKTWERRRVTVPREEEASGQ